MALLAMFVTVTGNSMEVFAISTHPSLFATPKGVELARERVKTEDWAKLALEELKRSADQLKNEELPIFQKDWWSEASQKHWSQIYPEINHHTNFAVNLHPRLAADAASIYLITSNTQYAELAAKVLLHYCDYEFFAEHPDVGLNWSVWYLPLLKTYDFIYSILTDNQRERINDFFTRGVQAVMKNDQWWIENNPGGMFNNHFAGHKLVIASYALFYNQPDLLEYAMNSDQAFRELIEHGVMDDGLWFESSINYHFVAANSLATLATLLANSGSKIDLWNMHFANGRCLRNLYTAPVETLFPDETIPTIGDTYGHRAKPGDNLMYFSAYNAYQLPQIAWILRNSPIPKDALFFENIPNGSAKAPKMVSRLWPEHGYIALRTQEGTDYWKGQGFSVFLSRDIDSIHSHHDKFSMMVFGRGKHLAVDPEALATPQHAFSSQIQKELNRSTICHNTVMVDQQDHHPIAQKLELVEFIDSKDIKLATVADSQGAVHPGVKMMRTVAATNSYVLDVFQLVSGEIHTYDYLYHSYSDDGKFTINGDFSQINLGHTYPWKWLKNGMRSTFNESWKAIAKQDNVTMRLTCLGAPDTKVITCSFPKKDDFTGTPVPMLIARRKASSTTFITLTEAEKGALPQTTIEAIEDRHNSIRIRIIREDGHRDFLIRKLQK